MHVCREAPTINVRNEDAGLVLSVFLPFVGLTRSSIDVATKTIRIVAEPDLKKMCKFIDELPKGVVDVVRGASEQTLNSTT